MTNEVMYPIMYICMCDIIMYFIGIIYYLNNGSSVNGI